MLPGRACARPPPRDRSRRWARRCGSLLGLDGLTSNTHLCRVYPFVPDLLIGSGGAGHEVEQTAGQGRQRCLGTASAPGGSGRRGVRCHAEQGVVAVSASCRGVLRSLRRFVVERALQKCAILASFLLKELCA